MEDQSHKGSVALKGIVLQTKLPQWQFVQDEQCCMVQRAREVPQTLLSQGAHRQPCRETQSNAQSKQGAAATSSVVL